MIVCHLAAIAMLAAAGVPLTSEQAARRTVEERVFTEQDLEKLDFLVGRWTGTAPDGNAFFEEYSRPEPGLLRSQRYKDASFGEVVDGSTVALKDGKLVSTWGEFTWEATFLGDGEVRFAPLNAPSTFSWRRIDKDRVEVRQNWTDAKGVAQSYALELRRVR